LLTGLAVDPMAADAADWTSCDWELFRNLLRLAPSQILQHKFSLLTQRQQYLREIAHISDLFLDPDTGVATGQVGKVSRYIRPIEIHTLLGLHPSRVVAVYQHIRAVSTHRRLDQIMLALGEVAGP